MARLHELTQSKNENVALGACKALLDKSLPDIKYDPKEMMHDNRKMIILNIREHQTSNAIFENSNAIEARTY